LRYLKHSGVELNGLSGRVRDFEVLLKTRIFSLSLGGALAEVQTNYFLEKI
jgi:hypothetical protein